MEKTPANKIPLPNDGSERLCCDEGHEAGGSRDPGIQRRPGDGGAWCPGDPAGPAIQLDIQSSVLNQYGKQIKATILETLQRLEVTDAQVTVVDKGALDCTLKARVECAVFRSCDASGANIPWGGAVR